MGKIYDKPELVISYKAEFKEHVGNAVLTFESQ